MIDRLLMVDKVILMWQKGFWLWYFEAIYQEGGDTLTALSQIFLYTLAFNIGWSPLQVTYVVEILPYHLRAKVSIDPVSSYMLS